MTAPVKMIGMKFGRLMVVDEVASRRPPNGSPQRRFRCRCDCGLDVVATGGHLRTGHTLSCGCIRAEQARQQGFQNRVHGEAPCSTAEYRIWKGMFTRCYNPKTPNFRHYGGRGITICDRWREDYPAFLADMGRRPSAIHSIDRIDNDGDYEPGNCKWSTPSEQNSNQRRCRRSDHVLPGI